MFDQPNLYFLIHQARLFFESVAQRGSSESVFDQDHLNPISGFVHDSSALNNAYYSIGDGHLYFGDIQRGGEDRYTSRSRDIAIHEYGHAVSDAICRLGRSSPHIQSRAMSEGYSDYFAATDLDNPIIGDYFENNDSGLRNCDNTLCFPRGYAGDEHSVGEIWAGFLWSMREDIGIGKDIADLLTLESLYFLGPWRTIIQGMEALVLVDRKLFPEVPDGTLGKHERRIRALFEARRPMA